MRKQFSAAPWSGLLKSVSIISTLLLVGAGVAVARTIPTVGGSHLAAILAASCLPAIALVALLFVVISYEIDGTQLRIRRLLWHTCIDLTTMQQARADPTASQGSIRTAGNGGLFSFTGYYRSQSLGSYEAYVTDWRHAVIMRLPRRVIVTSPADPAGFVLALRAAFPPLDHNVREHSP